MIVSCTPYPSRYMDMEEEDTAEVLEPVGRMYLLFTVSQPVGRRHDAGKRIAHALSNVVDASPRYYREKGMNPYYTVGAWQIHGCSVASPTFTTEDMSAVLEAVKGLTRHRFRPDGRIEIRFVPEKLDVDLVVNANTILAAREELIQMALALPEPPIFVIHEHPAFSIPLDAFDLPVLEACACLYQQLLSTAGTVKKAHMQPCDMSNPKYYMRTWLLRLGFIGPTFERARHTLLARLDGNGAFFTEENRKKALDKAKTKRRRTAARTLSGE